MCVRPIITYGHQTWAAVAKSCIRFKLQLLSYISKQILFPPSHNTYKTHSPERITITTQTPSLELLSTTIDIQLNIKVRLPKHATYNN